MPAWRSSARTTPTPWTGPNSPRRCCGPANSTARKPSIGSEHTDAPTRCSTRPAPRLEAGLFSFVSRQIRLSCIRCGPSAFQTDGPQPPPTYVRNHPAVAGHALRRRGTGIVSVKYTIRKIGQKGSQKPNGQQEKRQQTESRRNKAGTTGRNGKKHSAEQLA